MFSSFVTTELGSVAVCNVVLCLCKLGALLEIM